MGQISSGSLTIVDVTDGAPGLNNTTVFLYQRATNAPDKPTGNLTYTFATATVSGSLEGWTQNINNLTGTNPIWMIAAVASSTGGTDVIEPNEWAGPIKMAQNGQDGQPGTNGLNQATVFIYKRGDSATAPSAVTYTFATGSFTVPSGWSKTIPTTPKGKPCWITSAIAIGAEATAELNWVTPSVLVENGSDGVSPTVTATENGVKIVDADGNETFITNGADGTSYYTFVRYSKNANGSGYVATPTSETIYIGVYTGTKSSPPAYNDSGWTWSKYVGADGQPGAPGSQGPQGVSVTATRELYYLKTNSTDPAQITSANQIYTTDDVNQWTSVVPTYIGSGKYYTCIETTLSNGNVVWSAPVENKGLTDANVNAANAIEIARGVKQHFFWVATDKSANIPAGAYVAEESEESFYSNPTKGNILTRSDGIWIRNGVDKLATLQGSGLTFLVPTGTYKGQKSVSLNGSGLTFYNIGSSNSAAATLASDGLQITNGSIVLGTTSGTSAGNVTLSNKNFTRSINGTSHNDLRFAIGSKFGVASDGTLYSSGLDSVASRVDKTEAHLIGMYATSSTAAGTAAKVATITPAIPSGTNWELGTGTTITVKFTNANTTASPTLNVNSKGAKPIKTYANGNLSESEYKWKAGSTFTFTYNGTNWLMQDSTASVRLTSNETSITQTADSIISLASGNTTYTKPDGTTATSAIGTTVSQTANNVLIKATRSGATDAEKSAGGTSAIGLINVSPDNVVIAAKHVDIAGAAVFNDYSTTQQMNKAISGAVDNIDIGGRNLLLHTEASEKNLAYLYQNSGVSFVMQDSIPCYKITGNNKAHIFDYMGTWASTSEKLKANTEYTYSAWIKVNKSLNFTFISLGHFQVNNANSSASDKTHEDVEAKRVHSPSQITANKWTKISITFTTNELDGSSFGLYPVYSTGDDTILYIHSFKLEKGNKATDWTSAPEDVQAEIDAKKSTHTLMSSRTEGASYSTILGWTSEGTTGGWEINTATTPLTNVNVGDTVRIAYKANDMGANGTTVYCIGTVTAIQNSESRITMVSHGLDTTVIDGGHILTGTLDATKVNVTNLNASNISSGSIASDRIKANVISAVNNGTGTINADKINVSQINIGSLSGTIGGRNLLRNTVVSNLNREKCNFPSAQVSTTMTDGIICYKFTGNNTVHGFNYTGDWGCLSSRLKANTTYTYSFWAKYSKAASFNFSSYGHFQVNNANSSASDKTHEDVEAKRVYSPSSVAANVWTKMSITFTTNNLNGSSFGIYPLLNNGADAIMYAYGFKLEEGSRATDWTPAPEDSFGENIVKNANTTTEYSVTMSSTESDFKNAFSIAVLRVSGENVYTVSFDAKATTASTVKCFWYGPNTTTAGKSSTGQTTGSDDGNIDLSLTTAWQRYSITWVQSDTDATNKKLVLCRTFVPSSGSVTVSVRAVKMEVGAIANPWSDTNNYITQADNNGIRVHPSSTENNSVVINASGMEVFKGGTGSENSVAFFGATSRIGNASGARVVTTSTGIQVYNSSNEQRAEFGGNWALIGNPNKTRITISTSADNPYIYMGDKDNVQCFRAESSGVTIGNPSKSRVYITPNNGMRVYDKNNKQRLWLDWDGFYLYDDSEANMSAFTPSSARIGKEASGHATIKSDGLHVWTGTGSTATNEVAFFGSTARVGVASGKRFEIKSDGAYIYNGTTQLGYYGTFTRIGDYNGKNVRIDGDGVKINSSQDNDVASFGATTRIGKAADTNIVITPADTDSGIKMNVKNSAGTSYIRIADIGFDNSQGYETSKNFPKGAWYTFGDRAGTAAQRGYYSLVAGFNCIASHNASVSTGINNKVYAPCGFAVGMENEVGDSSKTSQNSYTSNGIGNCSATIGYGLKTGNGVNQLVCGEYNQVDTNARFIVGGGGSASTRYNLFSVGADRIYHGTHTVPSTTSTSTSTGFYLGLIANRWRQLYCWSAPNTGSDGKAKDVLGDIDFAKELIMGLEPVEFQWKDSDHIRSHMGFIAQDAAKVGKALGKNLSFYEASYIDESKGDYHGEEVSDEELSWGMMYDELIAPLVKVVQMQQKEIDQLKQEVQNLKNK